MADIDQDGSFDAAWGIFTFFGFSDQLIKNQQFF